MRLTKTHARVVLTEGLSPEHCPYITLSHSGLIDSSICLTTANIQALQSELVLGELPKLVQLAVQATKALKFRYLWVEELCIVQDSIEDVTKGQLDIGHIHANSWITITTSSLNFMYRLLQGSCDGGHHKSSNLNLMHDKAFSCSSQPYTAVPENIWTSEMFDSNIARDGAHFAKRFALQRNLHFGKTQLYWKCASLMACESLPNGDPRGGQSSLADKVSHSIMKQRNQVVASDDALWCRPVEQYTKQTFADLQSRLARFSCVAEEVARGYDLTYLAGLWRETLVADLLWYVDGTPTSRSGGYCAPSWSWASVTGAITYVPSSELVGTCYITIKDAHTNLANRDISTGPVVGGYIHLHGYLIEVPKPTFFCIRGHYVAGCFYPDDPSDITEDRYFCLPVRKQLTPQGIWLCGLVLLRMESSWGVEYRRVGMFRCKEGDSLHLLGQKVRGKAGSTFYAYETHAEKGIDGKPFAAEITII